MMAYRVRWCRSVARTYAVHVDTYSIFIVQELLIGGSLQTLLDAQGKLTEQEAAAALFGVLDALVACHDEGICYGGVCVCAGEACVECLHACLCVRV